MKTNFLQKDPFDRPGFAIGIVNPHQVALARLGRLMARKRDYDAQIRAIDVRIKQELTHLACGTRGILPCARKEELRGKMPHHARKMRALL